jgi:nitrogenase molybdenum-iron protein alpha/beta subunit
VEEIKRYLEAIDVSVNSTLTYNTSVEEIKRFNNAKVNLYLTYENLPKLNKYEEEYGFERIGLDIPLPIGVANTEDWFYSIADRFGKRKKAEEFLKNEKKVLNRLRFLYNSTWLQTWLSSKYAVVIGPATWAASFANFIFYDLAIYPAVIALYGDTDDAINRAKGILKDLLKYHDSIVLENPLYIQVADAAKDAKVEFSIGQTQEKSLMEGYGIAHLTLAGLYSVLGTFNFIPYPSTGYKGILYLLTMLGKLLENAFLEPEKWKTLAYRRRDEIEEE